MFTDTLVYDIEKEKMTFFGPTKIINGDNVLVGNYGWYDGIIDVAFLDNGATLSNKEYSIRSDSMFYDRTTEFAKAMSRVKIQDTVNKAIIEGNYAEMWKNKGKTLVTDSVRALYYGDKDTLFLHSDTLFFYMDTAVLPSSAPSFPPLIAQAQRNVPPNTASKPSSSEEHTKGIPV